MEKLQNEKPKCEKPSYEKPKILNCYEEKDFVTKEMPFVGATSNYKTFIPMRPELEA